MPAVAARRAFTPHTDRSVADLSTRLAVSLSMLAWLGIVALLCY